MQDPGKLLLFQNDEILIITGQFLDQNSQDPTDTKIVLLKLQLFANINSSEDSHCKIGLGELL